MVALIIVVLRIYKIEMFEGASEYEKKNPTKLVIMDTKELRARDLSEANPLHII